MPQQLDSITSQNIDTLLTNDSLAGENFLQETGQGLFEIFIKPAQTLYKGNPIDHWENIWQFGFLLAVVLMLAILRTVFGSRMHQFFAAVFATRQLRQLMREEGFLYHPFSVLLLVNTGIVYALIIYKAVSYFEWYSFEGTGVLFYLMILLTTLIILLSKIILLRFMEFLTDTDQGQRENRYTWIMFHQLGGIILLPIAAIMLFGKAFWVMPTLIFALSLIIIFLIFRIGKGFLLAESNKVYFLHIFLYLCALEIIPLIVLIKVLVSQINGFNE